MKKFIVLLFILFLVAAGCSSNNQAGESGSSDKSSSEQKKGEASLEISDSTGGAWTNSIGTVWVHSAAVFKNTGSVPVEVGETQMNYKGQDDSILGTSTMIYSVPRVVQPGETAFIGESTILDGISDSSQYKETTYNFSFEETSDSGNILEVSGVKGMKGNEFTPYKVTGLVKNTTEEMQEDIRLAAGLFDANGKLLGVLTGSVDVGVNPGSEAGFELSYPEIPEAVVDQIATVEVKSYAWTW